MRFFLLFLFVGTAFAQNQPPRRPTQKSNVASPAAVLANGQPSKRRQFALNVINSAVALPQTDQQDRLRVLASAVEVLAPIAPSNATELSKEGVRIESELIGSGQKPSVSLFESGKVDCATAVDFAQRIYPQNVGAAEQSLIAVLTKCPKQAGDVVRSKADAALDQRALAPRLIMALINLEPKDSAWSKRVFIKLFSSFPDKTGSDQPNASDLATMLAATASKLDKDLVRDAGLSFFRWLGKQDDSGDKNLAINITASALRESLGDEGYKRVLESDPVAQQVARLEGAAGQSARQEEESVSVAQSMTTMSAGTDKREELKSMPASMRARQAAAYGFAKGTSGDKAAAGNYFDVAFSAADEAWAERADKNVAPLIQEVSEAAAQVDPLDALRRAQGLQDPSAKAIGMIAVARVVLSKDLQM